MTTPNEALREALDKLEHCAMGCVQDPSEHSYRRLNDAREVVLRLSQPPAPEQSGGVYPPPPPKCNHADWIWSPSLGGKICRTCGLQPEDHEPATPTAEPAGDAVAVPQGWMRDEKQVRGLLEHLTIQGWRQTESGPDCVDQGSAMAAEVIERVLLPMLSASPAAPEAAKPAYTTALEIRTAQGWKLTGEAIPVLYTDTINDRQVMRDDVWLCTTAALRQSEAAKPEQQAQAEERTCGACGSQECVAGECNNVSLAGLPKPALWFDAETGHWKKLTKPDRPTYEPYYSVDQMLEKVGEVQERLFAKLMIAMADIAKKDAALKACVVDRGDAVNLARNMLEIHDCKGITEKGVRVLCDAVMRMDAAIRQANEARGGTDHDRLEEKRDQLCDEYRTGLDSPPV